MQNLIFNAKVAVYAKQMYLTEVTRGIAFVLLVHIVIALWLKRIEQNRRRLSTVPAIINRVS